MSQNNQNFSDAAGRYALSLFEIGNENKILNQIEDNINFIHKAFSESKDFQKFISNPTLKKIDRINVINELSKKNSFNEKFENFLKILVENNRIFFLEKITNDFKKIVSNFKGELDATVSIPTKMSDDQIQDMEKMLNDTLNKKVNLDFKLDKSLISGAKIQIGSLMVDDTAKAKFNKILNNL